MIHRLLAAWNRYRFFLPIAAFVWIYRIARNRFYWLIYWLRVRHIAWSAKICGFPRLENIYSDVTILPNAIIGSNVTIAIALGGRLSLGQRTKLTRNIVIGCNRSIHIGNDVLIAEFVSIRDSSHVFDNPDRPIADQGENAAPVVIEDDVWVGRGSVVLGGARVGRGAIIGANTVVNGDVEPYAIVVGAPAKIVGRRGMKYYTVNAPAK